MRYCFIINPNSRSQRGRAIWEEVQKELEKSQIKYEIYLTERRKNATAIAAMLTADQEAVSYTHLDVYKRQVWEERLGEIHAQLMGEVQIEILQTAPTLSRLQ